MYFAPPNLKTWLRACLKANLALGGRIWIKCRTTVDAVLSSRSVASSTKVEKCACGVYCPNTQNLVLRSASPSGMCAKLRTAAATQGRRQREGQWCLAPPFEIGVPPFHVWPPGCCIRPMLYLTIVAPPFGFWPSILFWAPLLLNPGDGQQMEIIVGNVRALLRSLPNFPFCFL